MKRLFLSYKTDDRERAARVVALLRGGGFDVWWDQDIGPGQGWRQTIEEQLAAADLCLVLWSTASSGREGQWVKEEAEYAKHAGKYLGILIDEVAPPFGFAELQSVHATRWDDAELAKLRERLFAAIATFDGATRPAPPQPERPAAAPPPAPRKWGKYLLIGCLGVPGVITILVGLLIIWSNRPHDILEKNFTLSDPSAPLKSADVMLRSDRTDAFKIIQVMGKYPRNLPQTEGTKAGFACDLADNGTVRTAVALEKLDEGTYPQVLAMADGFDFQAYFRIDKGRIEGMRSLHVGFPVKGHGPCEIHTPDLLPYLGEFD